MELKHQSSGGQTEGQNVDSGLSAGERVMIEQKLGFLRNLVVLSILLTLTLGAVLLYQIQEIKENREMLLRMQNEAKSAIGHFMPALEERLDQFDKQVQRVHASMQASTEEMEQRIKEAEDGLVRRLDRELPGMIERYVERKLRQLRQAVDR